MTADWIVFSEKDPREFLVDHRRVRRAGTIPGFDLASPHQRDLHGREEVGTDHQYVAVFRLAS